MNALGGVGGVAVGAVFAVVLILVLVGGSQVYASAGRASDHLKQAGAIGTQPDAGAGGGAARGSLTDRAAPSDHDDPSQQTFAQLTHYYAANLSQGQAIFWASFVSMVVGFAIVFAGIVTAGTNTTTAIVGGVAGVLSQFIAATFLVALRSTQTQSTAYAQTLVELRLRDLRAAEDAKATELGLALLNGIAGDGAAALVNQTRAALAMGLIVKQPIAPGAAVTPPAPEPDDDARQPRIERTRARSLSYDTAGDSGKEGTSAAAPRGQ